MTYKGRISVAEKKVKSLFVKRHFLPHLSLSRKIRISFSLSANLSLWRVAKVDIGADLSHFEHCLGKYIERK